MKELTNDELETLGASLLGCFKQDRAFDQEFRYRLQTYIEATMSKIHKKKKFSKLLDQFANSDVAIKCNDNNGKR